MFTQTFKSETLRKLSTGMAIVMAFLVLFTFMGCGETQTESSTEETTATSTTDADTQADDGNSMSFTKEDIDALKDKFIFDEASGYYYHKHWNRNFPTRRTLTADVNKSGYYYLCSNMYGNKRINHRKVTLKMGDEKLTSATIDLRNKKEHRKQAGEGRNKFEVNYYTNYRDNGIFDAIGKNPGPFEVSFIGTESFTQFEKLTSLDVQALKDCHQLSLVLRAEAAGAAQ